MFNLSVGKRWLNISIVVIVALIGLLFFAPQVMAHHTSGGELPTNFLEGFISGLAHPVIGLDHFSFVVASGLLASGLNQGLFIPVAFVLATLIGTGIHLQKIDLPFPEIIVAGSVVIFGLLLIIKNSKNQLNQLSTLALAVLAIIAGIFHGYAYGEAIVGSEMSPLIAYLTGFAVIQLGIASVAFKIGKVIQAKITMLLGFIISAIGVVFLTNLSSG